MEVGNTLNNNQCLSAYLLYLCSFRISNLFRIVHAFFDMFLPSSSKVSYYTITISRGIDFSSVSVSTIFRWDLELFRQCDIFVFVFRLEG
jgi:hypothetical protein